MSDEEQTRDGGTGQPGRRRSRREQTPVQRALGLLVPLVGGLLVASTGPEPAYALNAASFAFSALLIVRIRRRLGEEPEPSEGHWRDLVAGLSLVSRSAALRTVVVAWSLVMLGSGAIGVAEIVLAKTRFQGSIADLREFDCSYSLPGVGRYRVNIFRQRQSLALAMRSIPLNVPTFDQLGTPAAVRSFATLERGLVLVVGAAGNGKSSTLAALLGHTRREPSGHDRDEQRSPYPEHDRPGRRAGNRRGHAQPADSCA